MWEQAQQDCYLHDAEHTWLIKATMTNTSTGHTPLIQHIRQWFQFLGQCRRATYFHVKQTTQNGLFGPPAQFTTFGMKIPGIERDGKGQAMKTYLTGDHRLLLTTEAELTWIRGSVSLLLL